ncbi:MAG: primosomal protein N' [Defluviitaleaceae bacterium]|nr:primosomal protein N' [Defluviitaleaceae bacterium]
MKQYALVCVDITHDAVDRLFHYAIPEDIRPIIAVGMRVRIPFGKRSKPITGYVIELSEQVDIPASKLKSIDSLFEDFPVFSAEMLSLAKWMQDKYYTTLANCLRCILPPGLPAKPKPLGEIEPPRPSGTPPQEGNVLTGEQENVVSHILAKLEAGDTQPILIHGVTGSGKTEVYLRAIAKVMEMGKQAVMLVPEISLTPQMVDVFKKRFGDAAAVTHSRLTAKERLNQWHKARRGQVSVMIGPRSAVFAPFEQLGIIIIDEEHEHTYRSENSPKFDTREVAIKRGELSGTLTVMGSATPSLETYHRAEAKQEYSLLSMPHRVNGMFPEVQIMDMRRELASGNASIFGMAFQNAMAENLAQGRQIILFLNRRGHSSFVSCRRCGHVMGCDNCRVNLTYHAAQDELICHYCGRTASVPKICPGCQSPFLRYFGVGTQKVEEEVVKLFPNAAALRMDMDTTKGKHSHEKILTAFRKGEAQILIGTQMIAKGLDFPNVTLVGIVAADLALFTGDFRAAEHTFQLLTQVSGRAGRAAQSGRVFIQTYNPEHYAITLAQRADYNAFYAHELSLRRTMGYPPFSHVFMVLFTGPDERAVITALHKLLAIMQYCNKKGMFDMLGPAPAFVSKVKKQFRWKLLVKGAQEEILKQFMLYCLGKLKENDPLKGISINLTLDPTAME